METFEEKIKKLRGQVCDEESGSGTSEGRLPSGCRFLGDGAVLCHKRKTGDGRYPYSSDGLILWAHSSGNISVQESLFNVFLDSREGKEPNICFFAGQKEPDGSFFPVSLLGTARQPREKGIKRYTVFTPRAAYYFTETAGLLAVVRVFAAEKKRLCFSVYAENISDRETETYLSAYFDPFLRHAEAEDFETKWYKSCARTKYGYRFKVTEYLNRESCFTHYASLRESGAEGAYVTTSRAEFAGGANESLNCSLPLQTGRLGEQRPYTEFTDTAVAGNILPIRLRSGEGRRTDYLFVFSDDEKELGETLGGSLPTLFDEYLSAVEESDKSAAANQLGIRFSGTEGALEGKEEVFAGFLRNVVGQTEFCARAKNYAGPFIGIRDVFQQLEAALAWIPAYCRGKIVEALGFIGEDGRAPRQYSYPPDGNTPPKMDLRAYIDQGVWIISTVYTYLCYTDDYSLLDEECGYYKFSGNTVSLCDKRDSVLDHLVSICDYLVSKLDADTGCLRALYGDWNDALDGLGKTEKEGEEFGNGVSVMASLQLYRNLFEMADLLKRRGRGQKAAEYLAVRETLKKGLIKNAVVSDGRERKILHGWGDDKSFFVGSYRDSDGVSRDGLTSNAFWILSGLYKEGGGLVSDILKAYDRLDSKYGLKTFEPYFSAENDKVGRINRLPKGTAENGATYVHATLFAIRSLFEIGEGRRAWEQIYKILPITHESVSTTPFVMPNSYIYNEEKGFDGESMNDWFTGSGCVLIKTLIGDIFGVRPTLDGIRIRTAEYMPCKSARIDLCVKGRLLRVRYRKEGRERRRYYINSAEIQPDGAEGIFLTGDLLPEGEILVEIVD